MDVNRWIEERESLFTSLSDQVWDFAELGYKEVKSAKLLTDILEKEGFSIDSGIGKIPTAFSATYGKGKPVIAVLGEFDALPGLSQDIVPERKPIEDGGSGHGCGHNLLGVGALAAAMAVKGAIDDGEVNGTIRYYGCPAEENGSGKAFMVKAGVFDDVDLTLTWHPGMLNGSISMNMLSNIKVRFKFHGRASHAAADPQNGRSALDAVELMNVGVNYLREHIITEARIHYVIINGGGIAPNVVPPYAESLYIIRAPKPDELKPIFERVQDVARGAALMTGTELEFSVISGASNLVFNNTIVEVFQDVMDSVTPPAFSDDERAFAHGLSKTFPEGGGLMGGFAKMMGPDANRILTEMKESLLYDKVLSAVKSDVALPGSTDVGDVSWVTPTGQIMTTCYAFGTPGHSWQLVAQSGMSIGHKGMLYAGKVIATTALEFMKNPSLLQKAQDEFKSRLDETPFTPLIPEGVKPPLDI